VLEELAEAGIKDLIKVDTVTKSSIKSFSDFEIDVS